MSDQLQFLFDPKTVKAGLEPAWKDRVDRWYQLDETSRALCDAFDNWKQTHVLRAFDQLIFICQGGSNLADAEFVSSGAVSPSKFIYTLPNIAPSVVCQLLGWQGPVYCFCSDGSEAAFLFAKKMAQIKSAKAETTLIVHTSPSLNEMGYRAVFGDYDQHPKSKN